MITRFKKHLTLVSLTGLIAACSPFVRADSSTFIWPTLNPAFLQGEPPQAFIQPAASGRLESGLFGCVRNEGQRFHEGIDLKAIQYSPRGEAEDKVYAFTAGRVALINLSPGLSAYGRYIVLEHPQISPPLYSLYAHLASVEQGIAVGTDLAAGTPLGILGRSANHGIPKSRAHLHLEIGLRLSDDFQAWWPTQSFTKKNPFGNYHGWNLLGIDPLDFFTQWRDYKIESLQDYIDGQMTACVVRIRTDQVPFFVRHHPSLLADPVPATGLLGWDIAYTPAGLPKQWTPLTDESDFTNIPKNTAVIVHYDPIRNPSDRCRRLLEWRNKKEPSLSANAQRNLAIIFGMPILVQEKG